MADLLDQNFRKDALRLKTLVEMATDGIITINRQGIIETVNPAVTELFGYSAAEMIGENIRMLMPQPDRGKHDSYLSRYQRTREAHIIGIGREVWGQRSDGTVFPLRLAVSEAELDENKIIYTGILHDLTREHEARAEVIRLNQELEVKVKERTEELGQSLDTLRETNNDLAQEVEQRMQVEQQLRAQEAELQKALNQERELNELKSRFLSMASHEFKTPLSTVLSSVELIEMYQQESDQPKREKHIGRIKSAVRQLSDVLNDFLSLTQIEQGKVEVSPKMINLQAVISSSIESAEGVLKPGQDILMELDDRVPRIESDPKLLRHILTNLISNAAKYSEAGQTILLRTEMAEQMLNIAIVDQGIGIPETDQKHIFDRFFRARNVENIKGTGLGLNIVHQYATLLGGELWFESQVGKGSTFQVSIPIHFAN